MTYIKRDLKTLKEESVPDIGKREPSPVLRESTGSVPTNRERLLAEALFQTLVACNVLREDCVPTGPELLCAAMTFCEGKEHNA